jgi:hypothetical protein
MGKIPHPRNDVWAGNPQTYSLFKVNKKKLIVNRSSFYMLYELQNHSK